MSDVARFASGAPWEDVFGYSRAVRAGPWIAISGTTGGARSDGDGSDNGNVGDLAAQTREALTRIKHALAQAGGRLEHVVRTRTFVTDISRWEEVASVHREFFADVRPAATIVEVTALIDPSLLVEIEADAYLG